MIEKIIELSIRNRFLVLVIAAALTVAGVYAVLNTPVDAIPDLSENQVIVFTDWMGRSPKEIEDQITYPLSRKLQGLAGVRAVRSSSEFNFSMITIIFNDDIDFYFARQRVTERLDQAATFLPAGAVPYLAPDATALGQIFWYTVETTPGNPIEPGRLWALNKFYIAQQLNSAAGVADVAIVGGTPLEYQIDVRPEDLRAYGITLTEVFDAVSKSNMPSGGGVVQKNNAEYIVRGVGWIKNTKDIEDTVIKEIKGTPIYVKNIATVQLGTQFRRSIFEKDGNEVTGGVVLMRHGENPLAVTERVKEKIQELQPGLPEGVHIVAAYDRTRLIHGAIRTLTDVMTHEMIIASIAVLLILMHFRSVFVICITLPLAVLFSFLMMWILRVTGIIDIQANIMSLAGITISIGILIDQAIVMTENATHHLKAHFGDKKVTGDIRELVIAPCRIVGRPIFFSVMIMLLSFIPVFMLSGREGKLFHPLAFTKSFAMLGVAIISITLVPALIPTFIKGPLRSEEENWIVHSFINIYKPLLTFALPWRNSVMWGFAALLILAAGMFPLQAVFGQGASEIAWKNTFLMVFALVTSLTVILTTGKGYGLRKGILLLIATCALLLFTGGLVWIGVRLSFIYVHLPLVGNFEFLKWLFFAFAGVAISFLYWVGFHSHSVVIWRTLSLASLVLIALWAYRFSKIGVAFMPALDEGATLDMPVTVPRASITQAADDLKARDALLRGFPEVESVIGKSGRADTPTDPAPLDMVETFVNYRPKELWPKRVLKYKDAASQTRRVLDRLESDGYVLRANDEGERNNLVNDASQKALERFDETMRDLSLSRYKEFERELQPELTRYLVEEMFRRLETAGTLHWPAKIDVKAETDRLAKELSLKYGRWLVEAPALEDVTQLSQDVARELKKMGSVSDVATALDLKESSLKSFWNDTEEFFGGKHKTLAGELLRAVSEERTRLWKERVHEINWELFDRGTEAFTWYAIEELLKGAKNASLVSGSEYRTN